MRVLDPIVFPETARPTQMPQLGSVNSNTVTYAHVGQIVVRGLPTAAASMR